jgi:hypothetical protein
VKTSKAKLLRLWMPIPSSRGPSGMESRIGRNFYWHRPCLSKAFPGSLMPIRPRDRSSGDGWMMFKPSGQVWVNQAAAKLIVDKFVHRLKYTTLGRDRGGPNFIRDLYFRITIKQLELLRTKIPARCKVSIKTLAC